jgi:hypothetical protein
MKGSGKDHRLIGAKPGKALVAPVRGELRRELGVIFLETDVGAAVFEFSDNHVNLLALTLERCRRARRLAGGA